MGKAQRAHHSLTERSAVFLHVSAPVVGQFATRNESVKTAVRPIRNAGDMPMLHRIEMNVVDMSLKIRAIANRVFPEAPLPDSFFAFSNFAWRSWLCIEPPRKATLDQARETSLSGSAQMA